jgi:heme-degrading monooxygenase HmoA
MHVKPERKEEWLRFTRDVGFPSMLKQPGCRGIWRLRERGQDKFKVMTLWESVEHLEAFNKGQARQDLIKAANGFADRSGHTDADETVFDVVADPPK